MKPFRFISITLFISILFSACSTDKIDNPEPVNETEVISHVKLKFTDEKDDETTYTYVDPIYREEDYDDPVIQLDPHKTYDVSVEFWNKSNPDEVENVTGEVMEERDDHFVEYRFQGTDMAISRTDSEESIDKNDVKIGLSTQWNTNNSADGSVEITLIHQPETKITADHNTDLDDEDYGDKGDHEGGETDAEIVYDLEVE